MEKTSKLRSFFTPEQTRGWSGGKREGVGNKPKIFFTGVQNG
jgi:hypothetical protein